MQPDISLIQEKSARSLTWVCLAVSAVAAAHVLWLPRITVDDAFISFRYARNLVEGNGLVFNLGERVEGYSNLLWVLLTAGGMKLGLDPIAWTRAMGAMSFLGVVALAMVTAFRLTASMFATSAVGILLATSTALCASTLSGLETGLFAFFVMAATTAIAWNRFATASWLLGLAAITRPEGAGLCVVATALMAFSSASDRRRRIFRIFGPCMSMVAALLLFRLNYYGQLLPNSVQAKSAMLSMLRSTDWQNWAGLILNKPGVEYAADFLQYAFGPVALFALVPVMADIRFKFAVRFMAAAVAMGLAVAVYNFGDWMSAFRLLTPYLPLLTLLVVMGAVVFVHRLQKRGPAWVAPARFAAAAVLLFCAVGQFQFRQSPTAGSPDLELADILNRSEQSELLASTDVLGRLGYYASNTRILDMAGLTDAHIARFGEPRPPFGRNDFGYVLACEPQFIMNNVRTAWHRHLNRAAFVSGYWWVDRPAWTLPAASRGKPRFVFVRRGTRLEEEIRNRFTDAVLKSPSELLDKTHTADPEGKLAFRD